MREKMAGEISAKNGDRTSQGDREEREREKKQKIRFFERAAYLQTHINQPDITVENQP